MSKLKNAAHTKSSNSNLSMFSYLSSGIDIKEIGQSELENYTTITRPMQSALN